jgi:hypothetical protein
MNNCCHWQKEEDQAGPFIKTVRIVLLTLIIIGIALILTQSFWVPKLVSILM